MSAVSSHDGLRARLRSDAPLIGAFVTAPSPELVEVAAYSGFDFAVIDCEHGAIDMGALLHMIRAGQSAALPSIVRVPHAGREFVLRALDAGAVGIVVPQIESPAEARRTVESAHYPPKGNRGAAYYSRVHRYTARSGFAAIDIAESEVVVGVQIESPAGVEAMDSILDVPGIDFVLAGAADLTVGYGRGPDVAGRVQADMELLAKACASRGIPSIIGAPNPEEAQRLRGQGFTAIVTGLLPLLMRAGEAFVSGSRATSIKGA